MGKYKGYDKVKDVQRRHRHRNRLHSLEYLQSHSCVDCGNQDPRVLEFDHVRGEKKFNVGSAISGSHRSWNSILLEIEKCEIRCANCHRIRHAEAGSWYDTSSADYVVASETEGVGWHGTKNGYSYHKCRCKDCTEAHRVAHLQYRQSIASTSGPGPESSKFGG